MPLNWSLPCLNCQTPVESEKAKTFAGVFVCPTCYEVAARLEQRGTKELKALLTVQRDAIRIALIERRLVLGPADPLREVSKREVLEQIVKLTEAADASKAHLHTGPGNPGQQPLSGRVYRPEVRPMGDAGSDSPPPGPVGVPGAH